MKTKSKRLMTSVMVPLFALAPLSTSAVVAKTEVKASSISPQPVEKSEENRPSSSSFKKFEQEIDQQFEQGSRDEVISGHEAAKKSPNFENQTTPPLEVTERWFNDLGESTAESKTSHIPDWAKEENRRGQGSEGVLVSKRFATIEEARKELEGFVSEQFEWRKDSRRKLPTLDYSELVALGGIARECVITWPLEVGDFTEPVYQVAVQVRLTEPVRKRVARAIKNRAGRKGRTFVLGGILLATFLFGVSSLYLRKHARHSEFESE